MTLGSFLTAAIGVGPRAGALRKLRWTDHVAIGELSEGKRARVVGAVRPLGNTMYAPLSGRACVAFDIRVTQVVISNDRDSTR